MHSLSVLPSPLVKNLAIVSATAETTLGDTLLETRIFQGRGTGTHGEVEQLTPLEGREDSRGCADAPTGDRGLAPTPLGPKLRRLKGQRWRGWGAPENSPEQADRKYADLRTSAGQAVLPEALRRVPGPKMAANLRSLAPHPPAFYAPGCMRRAWRLQGEWQVHRWAQFLLPRAGAETAWRPGRAMPNLSSKLHVDNLTALSVWDRLKPQLDLD